MISSPVDADWITYAEALVHRQAAVVNLNPGWALPVTRAVVA